MKKNYVSPEVLYVAIAEEDIIRTSPAENLLDQTHNMGNNG